MKDVQIKLDDGCRLPVKKTEGSSGFDLYCKYSFFIEPGERKVIPTGVYTAIPPKYEAQIRGRSGLALKGITVPLGTIDSDYRGEWGVIMCNESNDTVYFKEGSRIAQAVFMRTATVYFDLVQDLNDTARGAGGFGSTGK